MNKNIFIFSLLFFGAGTLFYALHNHCIIIVQKQTTLHDSLPVVCEKTTITFSFFKNDQWYKEMHTLPFFDSLEKTSEYGLQQWLHIAQEQLLIHHLTKLQDLSFSKSKTHIFISLTHSPFLKKHSIYEKYMLLKSLRLTLQQLSPEIIRVFLFVKHVPLQDEHLLCDTFLITSF